MGDRYMTRTEIKAAYPDEWVLLVDMKNGRGTELLGGRVVFHHPDRDRIWQEASRVPPPEPIGVFFMGDRGGDEPDVS